MSAKRPQIAYLCDMSPLDRNLYSGGNARIFDALQTHVGDVTILSQSWHAAEPLRRIIQALPDSLNLRLRWRTQLAASRVIARGVRAELEQGSFDVLFGAYAFQCLRHVVPRQDMVTAYTSDATQTVYRLSEVGGSFERKFPGGALLDGWVERCERDIFGACDVLLWPSQWLWDEAVRRYDLDPDCNHMVPWGAGIAVPPVPGPKSIGQGGPVRLLLIGRDWFAKGGPTAFDTMQALRATGIDARLTVIGCVPPEFHVNEWVTVHPSLNKAVPEELAQFNDAFDHAHFVVQPSFESYGFAFCEASAHGVPSLCLRVGGVPVVDGTNGHALPIGSGPDEFAGVIKSYLSDPKAYEHLVLSTRAYFESHLNWDAWGKRVADILRDQVARKQAALSGRPD